MEYCYQNFDTNNDGKVSPVEAKAVRNIDISGLDIYSIKGIEYFEILDSLKAQDAPLRSVTIPDSVTSIGSRAFEYFTSLTEVYCKATTPPTAYGDMFDFNASGSKIFVPAASVDVYKAADGWSNYEGDIVGYDF